MKTVLKVLAIGALVAIAGCEQPVVKETMGQFGVDVPKRMARIDAGTPLDQLLGASVDQEAAAAEPGVTTPAEFVPSANQGPTGVYGFAVAHLSNALTTTNGRTLYIFAGDPANTSLCNGSCEQIFQPYLAPAGARGGNQYGLFYRQDGRLQWTIKSKPLYIFSGDTQINERKGHGYNSGSWTTVPYPSLDVGFVPTVSQSQPLQNNAAVNGGPQTQVSSFPTSVAPSPNIVGSSAGALTQ